MSLKELKTIRIAPQPGPQTDFFRSAAEVVLYGGAAGGGKSWSILVEPLRHINKPTFIGCIVRKTYELIAGPGGLLDASKKIYPNFGGVCIAGKVWKFPSGAEIHFKHNQREAEVESRFQGLELAYIGIDEGCQFSFKETMYMQSRNRSTSGVKSYMRISCNPDYLSFWRTWIDWWLDEDGFAIKERSGIIRWFIVHDKELEWFDTRQEALDKRNRPPISFTFIASSLDDNEILMNLDTEYKAKLENLPAKEQMALLHGCWNDPAIDTPVITKDDFERHRTDADDVCFDDLRFSINIDPQAGRGADETGISVTGATRKKFNERIVFVVEDVTDDLLPEDWAALAIHKAIEYSAEIIIAEKNQGGEMIRTVLKNEMELINKQQDKLGLPACTARILLISTSKNKHERLKILAGHYRRGRVRNIGKLIMLEKQFCGWDLSKEIKEQKSPDRVDSLDFGADHWLSKPNKSKAPVGAFAIIG